MVDLTGKKVMINGIKGTVTVDHEDGTWSVALENNTVYFAVASELGVEEVVEELVSPKKSETKFEKIYKHLELGNTVMVDIKGERVTCIVKGNFERNYFFVKECITGKHHLNVHIRRVHPSGIYSPVFVWENQQKVLEEMNQYN